MALIEYQPGTTFPGVIGRPTEASSPAWPEPIRALPGAPKPLISVLDDSGFGQLGCDGSPIPPPNLDATVEEHRGRSVDLDHAGPTDGQGIDGPGMAGGRW